MGSTFSCKDNCSLCVDPIFNYAVNDLDAGGGGGSSFCGDSFMDYCLCLACQDVKEFPDDHKMERLNTTEEILKNLNSGDIIILGGISKFSKWIETSTGSNLSHVIYVHKDPKTEKFYAVESRITKNQKGVGYMEIEPRLEEIRQSSNNKEGGDNFSRGGWAFLMKLSKEKYDEVSGFMEERVDKFLKENEGKKYDIAEVLRHIFEVWMDKHIGPTKGIIQHDDYRQYHCSELVSRIYQYLGIFPPDLNCSGVSPKRIPFPNVYSKKGYFQIAGKKDVWLEGYNSQTMREFVGIVNRESFLEQNPEKEIEMDSNKGSSSESEEEEEEED